jgi:hypothetical protein
MNYELKCNVIMNERNMVKGIKSSGWALSIYYSPVIPLLGQDRTLSQLSKQVLPVRVYEAEASEDRADEVEARPNREHREKHLLRHGEEWAIESKQNSFSIFNFQFSINKRQSLRSHKRAGIINIKY